jgi:hypothetical protein
MQRLYIADDLPNLRIAQLDPGWHTLAPIPVYQQPVEVSIGGLLLHAGALQGRPPLGSIRVVAMTVGAVIEVDSAAGSHRIWLVEIGIEALALALRDVRQPCAIGGGEYSQP